MGRGGVGCRVPGWEGEPQASAAEHGMGLRHGMGHKHPWVPHREEMQYGTRSTRGCLGDASGTGALQGLGGTRGTQGCSGGTQGPGAGQSRNFGCREALCPRSPVSWAGVSPLKWGGGRRNQQFPFSGQLLHPPGSSRNAARRPPLAPGTTPGPDTHPGGSTGGRGLGSAPHPPPKTPVTPGTAKHIPPPVPCRSGFSDV